MCIFGMLSVITFMNMTKKGGKTSKLRILKSGECRDGQHLMQWPIHPQPSSHDEVGVEVSCKGHYCWSIIRLPPQYCKLMLIRLAPIITPCGVAPLTSDI